MPDPRLSYATNQPGRLNRESFPMRLFQKAKKLGVWDPFDLEFGRDRDDWQRFTDLQRDSLLQLTALFVAGEEGVTRDLLPLLARLARQGWLEEEIYLTSFLFEEAKHVDFFCRFLDEVAGERRDLHEYQTTSYRRLFGEALPEAMEALGEDASTAALARAAVTYNMIIEGVLAETGYHAFFAALERNGTLPGLRQGLAAVKRDESRHVAFGVYLLGRLLAAEPGLWGAIESRLNELLPHALALVSETLARHQPHPFGLTLEEFTGYALGQFGKRLERLRRVRAGGTAALGEVELAEA